MKKISVVMPVYNEGEIIDKIISEWEDFLKLLNIDYEIIICEDGSTDQTKDKLSKIFNLNKRIINNCVEYRRGYGRAVISGIQISKSEHILCIDSDGQCDPKNLVEFIKEVKNNDFVIGWRKPRKDRKIRLIYSFLFKCLHDILFNSKLNDPSCPFIIIKKSFFLEIEHLLLDVKEAFWWAFVGAAIQNKAKYNQIAINHRERMAGETQVYQINKMPLIIIRNIYSLIKIKFIKPIHS